MSNTKSSNQAAVPEAKGALDRFKFEVVVFIFDCFGVAMLVYEARRIIHWKFSYTKEEHGKFIAILYFLQYNYI